MLHQRRLVAVVASLLIGCAVLASLSRGAAAEEDRCKGTRTIVWEGVGYATNDVPGCPSGGLLSGTESTDQPRGKQDLLAGKKGNDEIRGLGAVDELYGGVGSDVLHGGDGMDFLYGGQDDVLHGGAGDDILLVGGRSADVIYGGEGNDYFEEPVDGYRDKLYCGEGKDDYLAEKIDYVDSSCEGGRLVDTGAPLDPPRWRRAAAR